MGSQASALDKELLAVKAAGKERVSVRQESQICLKYIVHIHKILRVNTK